MRIRKSPGVGEKKITTAGKCQYSWRIESLSGRTSNHDVTYIIATALLKSNSARRERLHIICLQPTLTQKYA